MTTLREAAQQALEFVTSHVWGTTPYMDVRVYEDAAKLRDALKAALAEPTVPSDCTDSHQPMAWLDVAMNCAYTTAELDGEAINGLTPLYTATPQPNPLITPRGSLGEEA